MKFMGKILSVCALLVAASNCYGTDQGQKINFYITNNILADDPVYGNVYETNVGGKVTEKNPVYYILDKSSCLEVSKNKPASVKGRISKYHNVIFARTEQALKAKVQKNKNSNDTDSMRITQSFKQGEKPANECYSIVSVGTKKNIKITLDSCTSCGGNYHTKRSYKISGISDNPPSNPTLMDDYTSGIKRLTGQK